MRNLHVTILRIFTMRQKRIRLNKYTPIFRIPKEWIDPPNEKRTKIPLIIDFTENAIIIKKEQLNEVQQ